MFVDMLAIGLRLLSRKLEHSKLEHLVDFG